MQGCVLRLNSCEVYKNDFKNIYPVISQYQHLIEINCILEKVFSVLPRKGCREKVERDGSEKMDGVGDRWGKIEGLCSTGHSPQWAVAPTEEEEEDCLF